MVGVLGAQREMSVLLKLNYRCVGIQQPTWAMEHQSISFPKYVAKVNGTRKSQ
jgi:hypothetical protein